MNNRKNISQDEWEAIEKFIAGELDAETSASLQEKFETDPDWQAKLQEIRLLQTGIAEAALHEKLARFHEALPNEPAVGRIKRIPIVRRLAVAASLLIIVSVAGWLLFNIGSGPKKLYRSFYHPDPGLATSMAAASENYIFEKAMVDYKKGNYASALTAWDSLYTTHPQSDTLQYFIAAAMQAMDNVDKAAPLLAIISANPKHPFYRDACWYYGLILLRRGNKEQAIELLNLSGNPRRTEVLQQID